MDLNRAATFVRVVELGSFTRAAAALARPTSSVSRSVRKLEDELGVTLLERTTRRIAMTDAGRAFFERAREALAGLDEATSLAAEAATAVHGVVRIACPPEIGATFGALAAALADEHPRIRLELTFSTRGAELVGDLVDLAIAIGRLPDSSLHTQRLGETTNRLYAAPAYVARAGMPRAIGELAHHHGIALRAAAGKTRWELTGPRGRVERVDVPARIAGDHIALVTDAALAGLGIAMLPTRVAEPRVAAGALVAVLPAYSTQLPLHLLGDGSRHVPRRVRIVRQFLAAAMSVSCRADGHLDSATARPPARGTRAARPAAADRTSPARAPG